MKKRIALIMLIMLLVLSFAAVANASVLDRVVNFITGKSDQQVMVYVDGNRVDFPDQQPYIDENDRTLVPVRFVSEALGAEVDWIENEQRVDIEMKNRKLALWINKKDYTLNGQNKTMDTKAIITPKERTMVPIRFVSEGLGAVVKWQVVAENGVVHNFTLGQTEEEMQEIMDRVKKEIEKDTGEIEPEEVREFQGKLKNPKEVFNAYSPRPDQDLSKIKIDYCTIDELPAKVGDWTVYDIEINKENINIKQKLISTGKPIDIALYDGYYRLRQGTGFYEEEIYTKDYPVKYVVDEILEYPDFDMTDVQYLLLLADRDGWGNEILAVENPLYKGGNK